jgi:outer membrane murein-binding lipoprotein Lpp
MQKIYLLCSLVGVVLLCGCNKQARINSQKIDALSQRINQLEKAQAKQMDVLQAELNSLAPELNKVNSSYFERNRDDALFFHTNTLFLLLTIGKQIETQLQLAGTERQTQNSLAYSFHTNQIGTMYLCTAQIEDAMSDQQKAIQDSIISETRQQNADLSESLLKQIKLASTPDDDEIARRKQMADDLVQIQGELADIKARLETTNQTVTRP